MIFGNAKSAVIREGSVKKITDESGTVLWQKPAAFTNLADPTSADWKEGYRISSSGSLSAASDRTVTNWIKCKRGDILRTNVNLYLWGDRCAIINNLNGITFLVGYFTNSYTDYPNLSSLKDCIVYDESTGITSYTLVLCGDGSLIGTDDMSFRFCFYNAGMPAEGVIITINEEII